MEGTLKRAGEAIRKAREVRGLSQDDLCGKVREPHRLTSMTLRKVEQGQPGVLDRKLLAIDFAFSWPEGTTRKLREGEIIHPPSPAEPVSEIDAIRGQMLELQAEVRRLALRVDRPGE